MARIALIAGAAIAGALISVFTGGLGTFAVGAWAQDIIAGLVVGAAIGNVAASVIFPMKLPNQMGPRLNDLTVSTSTNGAPIPIGYGVFRYSGNVIWSPGLKEHSKTTKTSAKGGPSYKSTTYTYTASWATAWGEGIGDVAKIWFDSKVVYDNTVAILGINYKGNYDATMTYAVNDVVTTNDGRNWEAKHPVPANGLFAPEGIFGPNFWSSYSGTITVVAQQKYPAPTFYRGDETQLPDPLIQGIEGVSWTPAYRGLIYTVWEDFLLTDFGNRIPNNQALVKFAIGTL